MRLAARSSPKSPAGNFCGYIKGALFEIWSEFRLSKEREPRTRTNYQQLKLSPKTNPTNSAVAIKHLMYLHASNMSMSYFGAKTLIAGAILVAIGAIMAEAQDGCHVECYPNMKTYTGKSGPQGKGDNCRWILRTDGKAARLCDHIKCKKVCPNNQAASSSAAQSQVAAAAASAQQDQQGDASDNMRIEQSTEGDSGSQAGASADMGLGMGIMRHLHGSKLAKAPVPGVAGGRLAAGSGSGAGAGPVPTPSTPSSGGRRVAPTLPPAVQYDENDTPPPISRFLDISPEE